MNRIQSISKLIRFPNVLIVVLTMYLMRWSIVRPILDLIGFDPAMPEWSFALLVVSTAVITAAGNVINDFHDVKADRVNNPERVVIDRYISRRQAILCHIILNFVGVVLGVFISLYHWIPWLSLIFIGVPVFLWLYSLSFKHQPFVGNLIVSVLAATVPLLVILFEYPLLLEINAEIVSVNPGIFRPLIYWIGMFAVFAFLTNLIRELVKDGEDVVGDTEIGSRTVAIVYGQKKLKYLVFSLSFMTLVFLSYIFLSFLRDQLSILYFTVCLVLPFLYLLWTVVQVKQPSDWGRSSFTAKLIMLFGLVYAPIAFLIFDSFSRVA